jgi:hypothetical protein
MTEPTHVSLDLEQMSAALDTVRGAMRPTERNW